MKRAFKLQELRERASNEPKERKRKETTKMKGKNKDIGRETRGTSLQMLQTRETGPEYWGQCYGDASGK